jgi:D-sedoheptulose 7-phosphate isomerase
VQAHRVDAATAALEPASTGGADEPGAARFRSIADAYVATIATELGRLDLDAVLRVVARLRVARDAGSLVFIAGNGGSAATASHWVNDLGKATRRSGRASFRVIGLADNIPWFSALANDEGYDRVFAGQLENLARPRDVLMVISASGNSPNLVRAVDYARESAIVTIGLLGFDGGRLLSRVDEAVWIPTPIGAYGPVESLHSIVCDIVTSCLAEDHRIDSLGEP